MLTYQPKPTTLCKENSRTPGAFLSFRNKTAGICQGNSDDFRKNGLAGWQIRPIFAVFLP
jgi:hypothetical protein